MTAGGVMCDQKWVLLVQLWVQTDEQFIAGFDLIRGIRIWPPTSGEGRIELHGLADGARRVDYWVTPDATIMAY